MIISFTSKKDDGFDGSFSRIDWVMWWESYHFLRFKFLFIAIYIMQWDCDGGGAISPEFAKIFKALAKATGMKGKMYQDYCESVDKTVSYDVKGV